ncbi:MAG: hypothetical protein ACK5SL_01420 [Cyclobacteriaceae bacterium]|jgi:hypothetical protein
MRLKAPNETLISSDERVNISAKSRISSVTFINQSNATVKIGFGNDSPVVQLLVGQTIAYHAGENSFWGDTFIKVNFGSATVKEVAVLFTQDLGEVK